MTNCVYYIDYNTKAYNSVRKKITDKLFFRCETINLDNNKKILIINRKVIDKKLQKKIWKRIGTENFRIVCSNRITMVESLKKCHCFSGKLLFKNMIFNVIEYMEKIMGTDYRNEDIYVTIDNDKNIDTIFYLGELFKNVNIVTNTLKKMRRLEHKLIKDDQILYSISNNKKKSLKRAKIIINFDYGNDFFEEFSINRNCIIINLYENSINMKSSFHGTIVEGIKVEYINRYKELIDSEYFDKTILYESYIFEDEPYRVLSKIKEDECKIKKLYGSHSEIEENELKNNFIKSTIKLDKTKKKD